MYLSTVTGFVLFWAFHIPWLFPWPQVSLALFKYSSFILHCPCFVIWSIFREVASLSHKTLIFHGFQGPTIKFHDPQAWKMKFLNSMAFQVFQHNLCEPRVSLLQKTGLPFLLCHRSSKKNQWYCLCPVKSGKDSITYGLSPNKIFYFISLWITSRYPSQWLKDIKPKFETIITKNM